MRLKNKLTSILAVVMVSLITISLPVFAKIPKQPTGIPIPQYSTVPEVQYMPEPPQAIVPDDGTVSTQWNSGLHTNIIREGIAKFKRDNPMLASRLSRQISVGGGLYRTSEQLLVDGINWPDNNETDGYPSPYTSFMGHFWDPTNNTNYTGAISPTAYTRFNNHYFSATNASSALTAWNELSYSLHYFGDLNAPHHAANVPWSLSDQTHTSFESFADSNYSNLTTNWTGDYFVANSSILSIADYYARNARNYITQARSSSDATKRIAVDNTLPFAQSGAAGMIYRFVISTNW